MSDEVVTVVVVASGQTVTLPYRQAVSQLSRGLAVYPSESSAAVEPDPATDEDPQDPQGDPEDADDSAAKSRRTRKSKTLSAPAREGQEGDDAENKPLSDE